MEISSHKDLKVWQESMNLVIHIYEVTKNFPSTEQFGMVSQMRRSAVSIPSNIAEGSGRKGEKELCRFLYIALGSLAELETQLEISTRLNFILEVDKKDILPRIFYIRKMLAGLIKSLKT